MKTETSFCFTRVTFTRCSTVGWGGIVTRPLTNPRPTATRCTTVTPSTPWRPFSVHCYQKESQKIDTF